MKRPGLLIALALVVIVNIVVLTGVSANRRGEPGTTITLTERELPLSYSSYGVGRENSGVSLNLTWNRYETDWSWLNTAKMTELGFTLPRQTADEESHRSYRRPLPRKAYVILEYDGEQWQSFRDKKLAERARIDEQEAREEILPEAAKRQRQQVNYQLATASRLFAIDAGLDPAKLRQRYPDKTRYLVSLARIRMNYWSPPTDKRETSNQARGSIEQLLPSAIHVPQPEQQNLKAIIGDSLPRYPAYTTEEPPPPRYRVELHYGSRFEPWVIGISSQEG